MKIYHLAAECYPIAKIGGLGDVVGALPKYQVKAGLQAAVALPFYDRKFVHENQFDVIFRASTLFAGERMEFEIWKEKHDVLGFELYLIRIPGLLDRPEVYSYPDENEQFIAYQLAFLDWINWSQQSPDIIHCHDHHAGLVPFLLQYSAIYKRLANTPTVFTIHNGQYHGAFGYNKFKYLPEVDMRYAGLVDWSGGINPLASAVRCCSAYTTVSPSYMEELSWQSNGLERLFQMERHRGVGIVNGIDSLVWDPEIDPMIPAKYSAADFTNKAANKKALCERFNLDPSLPLISFIGRLVTDKGAELLAEAMNRSLQENPGKVNFLVLGTGDKPIEHSLKGLMDHQPDHYRVYIGYDESLSHQIYAGSDFLLMPSRVEPCGLNQLYSLRYGTIPMVHRTGGLRDTVIDFGDADGYGICFDKTSVDDICYSVGRAIALYADTKHINQLRTRMMELDFSWERSAKQYTQLYERLIKNI
ncbi:glycogen synthase [Mucilaginibacter myungsuensis]|uniref:Glycogen synthase n=1 Tax=Mucilaginibacter myungsuensis TaxID=649104 RepID=A0A929KV57_9SPHI|nr:glycogen/starch synthase [Mucilaginibacter myungsuensis]MBE9661030.1 glycogen synthase [Mucilaginibacter myungsuensis]MDN3597174.1 glycogen/starch synthase [Mucilaginibacter myungsuensis]